jgi:hypothetical protein
MVGVLVKGGKVLDDLAGMSYQVAELARAPSIVMVMLGSHGCTPVNLNEYLPDPTKKTM